jgi:hypothetical protein
MAIEKKHVFCIPAVLYVDGEGLDEKRTTGQNKLPTEVNYKVNCNKE